MPFEVTPFMLYLTREVNTNSSRRILARRRNFGGFKSDSRRRPGTPQQ